MLYITASPWRGEFEAHILGVAFLVKLIAHKRSLTYLMARWIGTHSAASGILLIYSNIFHTASARNFPTFHFALWGPCYEIWTFPITWNDEIKAFRNFMFELYYILQWKIRFSSFYNFNVRVVQVYSNIFHTASARNFPTFHFALWEPFSFHSVLWAENVSNNLKKR